MTGHFTSYKTRTNHELTTPLFPALVSVGPVAYRSTGFIGRGSVAMKILVVQGAGMNMRGKTQTEIFGTMTLDQYNQHITQYAAELDIEVEIFHSNIEGEVINRLYRQTTRVSTARWSTQPGSHAAIRH